jgi:hypothetical protein
MTRTEATTYIVITLIISVAVFALCYLLWETGDSNNEKTLQTQLACIEAGGTWVGSSAATCVQVVPK